MQKVTVKDPDCVSFLSVVYLLPAIDFVTDYGVSEVVEMHPDLMGPACTRKGANVSESRQSMEDFIVGEGLPRSGTSRRHLGP